MPSAGTAIIEYNANGGVGAPVSHSATIGDDGTTIFNLSTAIPSRDGFNFLGWRLYNDPAYGIDSPGQTITIGLTPGSSTTLTYWAQWENTKAVPKWYRPNLSGSGGRPGDPMYVTLKFDYPITELGFWVVRESDDAVVFSKSFSHVSGPSEFEYVIPYTEAEIYTIHGVIINGQRYEAYPIWTNKNLRPGSNEYLLNTKSNLPMCFKPAGCFFLR